MGGCPTERTTQCHTVTWCPAVCSRARGANTISLFRDGERVSVQTIPEILRGKPLVPTLVFKNVSIRWNFASEPISPSPLPFKCRMLQDAAAEDVELLPSHSQEGCDVHVIDVCNSDEL